jgi:hypothetical protein
MNAQRKKGEKKTFMWCSRFAHPKHKKPRTVVCSQVGPTGPTGPTGVSLPGTLGPPGPTGATGVTGPSGRFLRVQNFDSMSSGTFAPLPTTNRIHVQLWGAGGGGGGTGDFQFSAGSGGGGGGYTEADITEIAGSYDFFVAPGGAGGAVSQTGTNAVMSWFGSPTMLYAAGGEAGSFVEKNNNSSDTGLFVRGGMGGLSGGSFATVSLIGEQGNPGMVYSINTSVVIVGGSGGAAGFGSGRSLDNAISDAAAAPINGAAGAEYGGGGGGGATPGLGATGGTGNGGRIIVFEYGG